MYEQERKLKNMLPALITESHEFKVCENTDQFQPDSDLQCEKFTQNPSLYQVWYHHIIYLIFSYSDGGYGHTFSFSRLFSPSSEDCAEV